MMIVGFSYPSPGLMIGEEGFRDNTPTIKVAVFFTLSASDIYDRTDLNIFEYLEERENDIRQLLQNDENPINIEFTVKAFLEKYTEPSLRELSNPYTTFPHEEIDQVFDELAKHQAISDFLNDPANDSNSDNIWDDVPDVEKYYFANKDNLDTRYLEYLNQSKPDVVIIIANAQGEPLIVDDAIWEIDENAQYDQPLFAVLNANYFAESQQALIYTFFSLFCRADYSDSDLNTDEEPDVKRSLMSLEWTSVEGENRLTNLNNQTLRYNIAKLKLSSASLPDIIAGETIDLTYGQSHVDNLSNILFTPHENGTPTLISASTTAPEYGDNVGQDVPLASSYINYASGVHQNDPEQANEISLPDHQSTIEFTPSIVSLPISFDDQISSDNFLDFVEDDFGAESIYEPDGGDSNTNGMRIIKRKAEEHQWAITSISSVDNLIFTGSNKKLKMDVKSPDTNTDVMLLLEDDEGNVVTKEYTTDDLVANDWKEIVFDFEDNADRTGEINSDIYYTKISIQFNASSYVEDDKTYFIDNIEIANTSPLQLPILFNQAISHYEISEDDTEIETTIQSDGGASRARVAVSSLKRTVATGGEMLETEIGTISGIQNLQSEAFLETIRVDVKSPAKGRKITLTVTDESGNTLLPVTKVSTTDQWESLDFNFTGLRIASYIKIKISFEYMESNEFYMWDNVLIPGFSDQTYAELPIYFGGHKNLSICYSGNCREDFYNLIDFGNAQTELKEEGSVNDGTYNQFAETITTGGNSTSSGFNHGTEISSARGVSNVYVDLDKRNLTALISSHATPYFEIREANGDNSVITRGQKQGNATTGLSLFVFDFNTSISGIYQAGVQYDQLFIYFELPDTYIWDEIKHGAWSDIGFNQTSSVVDNSRPWGGEEVTFTLVVENEGDDATDVEVVVELPSGYKSKSPNPKYTSLTNIDDKIENDPVDGMIWTIKELKEGQPAVLTIKAALNIDDTKDYKYDFEARLRNHTDSNPDNDDVLIEVDPRKFDLQLKLVNKQSNCTDKKIDLDFEVTIDNEFQENMPVAVTFYFNSKIDFDYDVTVRDILGIYNQADNRWTINNMGPTRRKAFIKLTYEAKNSYNGQPELFINAQPASPKFYGGDAKPANNRMVTRLEFLPFLTLEGVDPNANTGSEPPMTFPLNFTIKNEGNCPVTEGKLKADINFRKEIVSDDFVSNPVIYLAGTINNWDLPVMQPGDVEQVTITKTYTPAGFAKPKLVVQYQAVTDENDALNDIEPETPDRPSNVWFYISVIDSPTPARSTNPATIQQPIAEKQVEAITENLTLYPNPFTNTFKVVYDRAENASDKVVATVYDLSGRVALVQQFSVGNVAKAELEIDGSKLAIGHYIIELNDGSGTPKRGRLIKER